MARDLDLALRVRTDLNRATREIKGLRRDLQRTGDTTARAARQTRGLASAWERGATGMAGARRQLIGLRGLLVGLGLAAALRGIVRATVRQEQAIAQVEARIRATGGAAGLTSRELQDMAASLQRLTTFGDEAVLEMQALLLSFREIKGDTFRDASETVLDLAVGIGTDLRSAAIQLGKALNDPIRGLDALSRSGTTFTDAQKDVIKQLAETGRVAEAQALILEEIKSQYGGAARAARDTLGGALTSLGNAWGDLLEVKDGTGELREEVDKLTSLLQDPTTVVGVQQLGAALIGAFAGALDFARALGISVARLLGDSSALEIHDLLRTHGSGRWSPGRWKAFNEDSLVEWWSNEDIDRRLAAVLSDLAERGEKLPEALVEGIRRSKVNVPAALLEAVTPVPALLVGSVKPTSQTDPPGKAQDPVVAATKETAEVERIRAAAEERIARLSLDRIALVRRAEAAQVDALARLGVERGTDAEKIEAATLAVRKAARLDIEGITREDAERGRAAYERLAAQARKATATIEAEAAALAGTYATERLAIRRWLAETLKTLEAGAKGHEGYAERVVQAHAIAVEQLKRIDREEAEQRLRTSKHWQDGVIRGLKDVAGEAEDTAAAMKSGVKSAFSGMEDALVEFVRTGKLSFSGLVDSILAQLARIAVSKSITEPLSGALEGILNDIFSPGLPGPYDGAAPGTAPLIPVHRRPLPPLRQVRHGGGIAGALGGVRRAVPPEVFAHAPRYHRGGIAGMLRPDEVPIIAQTGERILSRAETQALGQPPAIEINFENTGTPKREVDREVRFDGARAVVTIFLADLENHGAISQGLEGAYGIRRAGI